MFVTHLYNDDWQDRCDCGTEMDRPTWSQIENAINALEGLHKTQVILSNTKDGSAYMIISGNYFGRYLVNATPNNFDFFSLTDPVQSDKTVMLFVGGQNGDYAIKKLVPRGDAIEAARQFYETGELHSELNWASDY